MPFPVEGIRTDRPSLTSHDIPTMSTARQDPARVSPSSWLLSPWSLFCVMRPSLNICVARIRGDVFCRRNGKIVLPSCTPKADSHFSDSNTPRNATFFGQCVTSLVNGAPRAIEGLKHSSEVPRMGASQLAIIVGSTSVGYDDSARLRWRSPIEGVNGSSCPGLTGQCILKTLTPCHQSAHGVFI